MAAQSDSPRMSATSIFPIRWTPVPVTVSSDPISSSQSCNNPRTCRQFPHQKLHVTSKNLFLSAWLNIKNLLARSRQEDHTSYLERLAETHSQYTYTYSRDSLYPYTLSTDSSFLVNTVHESDVPPILIKDTLCSHCHGSNAKGTIGSNIAMESPQSSRIESKKSFDRDWKDIRQRLERKIAAAAAQAISGRPGGADTRNKPRWATPPKQKEPRYYQVRSEDKLTTRGANPRTGVVSPSNRTDSSNEDHVPRPRVSQKWKVNGDQWVSVDVAQTPSPRSSPLSYKLAKTVSSAGSGSTDLSSSDDWEDRFVVHMPSADDPNPPSMTAEQIRLYQEKIGKLHGASSSRHEMDASKPSSGSPEPRLPQQAKKISSIPVSQRGATPNSFSTESSESISPPLDGPRQYFSPDEVGRARVSPVTDNAKLRQKELFKKLREECFMGCMGVDEKGAKNPDEILLFPNSDDESDPQVQPVAKSDEESDKGKSSGTARTIQTSKLPRSAVHIIAGATQTYLGRPQRATPLVIPSALTPAHPTKIPLRASTSPTTGPHKGKEAYSSALTSAATGTGKTVLQQSPTRTVSKPSSQPSTCNKVYNRRTPENDLFFQNSPSGSSRETNHSPAESSKPVSPDSLGKGPGESLTAPSQSNDSARVSPSDSFKHTIPPAPRLHKLFSPTTGRLPAKDSETPKTPNVAELDGLQVPQQLPSPPLSCSPSPPPIKPQVETTVSNEKPPHKEKRDTHTIRMEIRMKAEKARQGAAAAKSASERLAAARRHAERLAEARAAYDKVKSQCTANKTRDPMDELKQQKLNTERINEARKAYKAAKAREEAEQAEALAKKEVEREAARQAEKEPARQAERQAEVRRKEAKVKSKTPILSSSSKTKTGPAVSSSDDAKPTRKTRKSSVRRQCSPEKKRRHDSNIEEPGIQVDASINPHLAQTALSFGVFYLSFTKFHAFLRDHKIYSQILLSCERVFQMASHCFKVCKRLTEAWLEYNQNGCVPQSCVDDFGDLATDIGQALVNFAVLCFVFVIVVKMAGYIVILTNWMVWLCRPVGWVLGNLLSAVM